MSKSNKLKKRKVTNSPGRRRDEQSFQNEDRPNSLSNDYDCVKKLKTEEGDILELLLKPFDTKDFLENYWEKKPLIIPCNGSGLINSQAFSKSILEDLLKSEDIRFGRDIHACRCVEGVTEDLNSNKTSKVTVKEFNRLFDKNGATIQFHQPQRFLNTLWNIMEELESFFTSLVAANTYITPVGTQGLAPHYDDVEVIIIQLEGEKRWRLYNAPVKHAREYKSNLSSQEIGEPTHNFILKPGDILYMPRGTIHQADSPETCISHSTHITLSTYQKHSWGDYLLSTFPQILEKAFLKSEVVRKGLPIGSLLNSQNQMEYFKQLMCEIPNSFETFEELPPSRSLIEDFMLSRLPPYEVSSESLEDGPEGNPPTIKSFIKLAYPKHTTYSVCQSSDDDDEDSDEEANGKESDDKLLSSYILVYTSIFNDRKNHMISSKDAIDTSMGTLKFPTTHLNALKQLSVLKNSFLPLKDLELATNDDKIQFATALWAQHLIIIQ